MPNEENIGDLQACGFEPLLNLKEAAVILGMHWKTLEGDGAQPRNSCAEGG